MAKKNKKQTQTNQLSKNPAAWYTKEPKALPIKINKEIPVERYERLFRRGKKIYEKRRDDELKSIGETIEEQLLTRGTSSDKIAALSLTLKQNPMIRLQQLDKLIAMCSSPHTREAELAIDATRDLFITDLLPYRELRAFGDNNLAAILELSKDEHKNPEKKALIENNLYYWFFEDSLKLRYKMFLDALIDKAKNTTIANTKLKCVRTMVQLICSSKEQRKIVIQDLVSKMGDKNKDVASKTLKYLTLLINRGPKERTNNYYVPDLDREMVVREVANFMLDVKKSDRARNYAAVFLSQIELATGIDKELARYMIETFITVCEKYFKLKKIEITIMSSLLKGIVKAFHYSQLTVSDFSKHVETMFKIARTSAFNVSIEAVRVLWTLCSTNTDPKFTSRCYTLIYDKLIDTNLRNSAKVETLLHVVLQSVKKDENLTRAMAITKRLIQTCFNAKQEYVCGVLIILREIFLHKPALRILLKQTEFDPTEEEEEVFRDVDEEEKDGIQFEGDLENNEKSKPQEVIKKKLYDPRCVRPQEANADKSCLWELYALAKHFHPSAAKFVEFLMQEIDDFNYEGNPFEDFTLARFLDKFKGKKAKLKKKAESLEDLKNKHINEVSEDLKYIHKYQKLHEETKKKMEEKLQKEMERKIELKNKKMRKVLEEAFSGYDSDASDYSYSELDKVWGDDDIKEDQMDAMLLKYGMQEGFEDDNFDEDIDDVSDDASDEEVGKKKKKKKKKKEEFAYDVEEGDIDDAAKYTVDEMTTMFEEEEEQDSDDEKKKKPAKVERTATNPKGRWRKAEQEESEAKKKDEEFVDAEDFKHVKSEKPKKRSKKRRKSFKNNKNKKRRKL